MQKNRDKCITIGCKNSGGSKGKNIRSFKPLCSSCSIMYSRAIKEGEDKNSIKLWTRQEFEDKYWNRREKAQLHNAALILNT
jgi:hypothetical protein